MVVAIPCMHLQWIWDLDAELWPCTHGYGFEHSSNVVLWRLFVVTLPQVYLIFLWHLAP